MHDQLSSWVMAEGLPYPLGVTWLPEERAFNFALYSKHATTVRLLLFADGDLMTPRVDVRFDPLIHKSGRVWHRRLTADQVADCRLYGYLVHGPASGGRFEQHAFDPSKLLLDPYAREVVFPPGFDRARATWSATSTGATTPTVTTTATARARAGAPTADGRGTTASPRGSWHDESAGPAT